MCPYTPSLLGLPAPVRPSLPGHRRAPSWAPVLCSCSRWPSVWHSALCVCQCYSQLTPHSPFRMWCWASKGPCETFHYLEIMQNVPPTSWLTEPEHTHISCCLSGASKCSYLGDNALNKICKGRRARAVVQRREEEKVWCLTVACSWEDPFRSNIRNTWGLKLTILKLNKLLYYSFKCIYRIQVSDQFVTHYHRFKKNTWENSSFIVEMYHLFSHLNSHFVLYT